MQRSLLLATVEPLIKDTPNKRCNINSLRHVGSQNNADFPSINL